MITVAIGDIHGMLEMLDRLLIEIIAFSTREFQLAHPKLVFLGDYVDRGPDARRVVRRVRASQQVGAVCLRGNHEEMMSKCENQPIDWQNFVLNGGAQTLVSYEGHEDEFEDDRRWMSKLPTSYEDELQLFVHAGIKPDRPLAEQTDHTKMWAREEFLEFTDPFPKYVVHGHTPTLGRHSSIEIAPDVQENRCNLDTGACYGGALSAAFFNIIQAKPFHTISVT